MAHTRIRTKLDTRVVTRTELCIDTAARFLAISERLGHNEHFMLGKPLKLAITNRFIKWLSLVPYEHQVPLAGIHIEFDWSVQDRICISYGEDVDMSDIPEGATFDSIQLALDEAEKYLATVHREKNVTLLRTWWQLDPTACEEYGEEEICRIVPELTGMRDKAKRSELWAQVEQAMVGGREKSMKLADAQEITLGAWRS